jgi:lantibiotic modifying enzyme
VVIIQCGSNVLSSVKKRYSILLTIYGSTEKPFLIELIKPLINYLIVNLEVSQFLLGFQVGFSAVIERVIIEQPPGN